MHNQTTDNPANLGTYCTATTKYSLPQPTTACYSYHTTLEVIRALLIGWSKQAN